MRAESVEFEPRELEVSGTVGNINVLDTSHIVVYFDHLTLCMMLERDCIYSDVDSTAVTRGNNGVVLH